MYVNNRYDGNYDYDVDNSIDNVYIEFYHNSIRNHNGHCCARNYFMGFRCNI